MALLSTNMHCSRSISLSDKPQPQHLFAAGVKKPCINSGTLAYLQCPKQDINRQSGHATVPLQFGAFRSDEFEAKAEELRREAMHVTPLAEQPISEAGKQWLKEHSRYIKPRTILDYQQYIKTLETFFLEPLNTIHIGTIRLYQDFRLTSAGASRINMELSTLQQILKEAKLWPAIAEFYRPLPTSQRGSGRSITKEDQKKLLEIAFRKRRRMLAAHCVRIMILTGVGPGELLRVKRQDVNMREKTFEIVEGAKNQERARTVFMTGDAFDSMAWIIDRFEFLGGNAGSEYIIPHCASRANGPRDFSRPMLSIKKAWGGIRKEAIAEIGPHMAGFRIYDCRVTKITRTLASGNVSIHTAKKLFGHVSEEMQRRYYKPDQDLMRDAMEAAEKDTGESWL